MPYDPNLDKELFAEEAKFETTKVKVSVHSYNEGQKKLQLSRQNMNQNGEWNFAKLGRMGREEASAILPLIKRAIEKM